MKLFFLHSLFLLSVSVNVVSMKIPEKKNTQSNSVFTHVEEMSHPDRRELILVYGVNQKQGNQFDCLEYLQKHILPEYDKKSVQFLINAPCNGDMNKINFYKKYSFFAFQNIGSRCGTCQITKYCNAECQKADWSEHPEGL